jgi:hypothetical protein
MKYSLEEQLQELGLTPGDLEFPVSASDLVDLLDRLHPPKCIGPRQDPIDAHRYAAVREMIDLLKDLRDNPVKDDPVPDAPEN